MSAVRALFTELAGLDAKKNYAFDQFPKGNNEPFEWHLNLGDKLMALINDNRAAQTCFPAELPSALVDLKKFFEAARAGEVDWSVVVLQQCMRDNPEKVPRATRAADNDEDEEYNPEVHVVQSKRLLEFDFGLILAEKFPYDAERASDDYLNAEEDQEDDDQEDAALLNRQPQGLQQINRTLTRIADALGVLVTHAAQATQANKCPVAQ
jgi:hypothetical protein